MKKRILIITVLLLFNLITKGQSKFDIHVTSNFLIKNQDTIYTNKKVILKVYARDGNAHSEEKSLAKLSGNSKLIIQVRV